MMTVEYQTWSGAWQLRWCRVRYRQVADRDSVLADD